jgi:hypothetical protein
MCVPTETKKLSREVPIFMSIMEFKKNPLNCDYSNSSLVPKKVPIKPFLIIVPYSEEFVNFVESVRSHRQGSMYPTIVHCSAGIGRTGVLILMESALYLIEANQPVYPLDLTRVMRDQRASMIQTPSQYKFVCQAILKVYRDGDVKPLPEFCQTTA